MVRQRPSSRSTHLSIIAARSANARLKVQEFRQISSVSLCTDRLTTTAHPQVPPSAIAVIASADRAKSLRPRVRIGCRSCRASRPQKVKRGSIGWPAQSPRYEHVECKPEFVRSSSAPCSANWKNSAGCRRQQREMCRAPVGLPAMPLRFDQKQRWPKQDHRRRSAKSSAPGDGEPAAISISSGGSQSARKPACDPNVLDRGEAVALLGSRNARLMRCPDACYRKGFQTRPTAPDNRRSEEKPPRDYQDQSDRAEPYVAQASKFLRDGTSRSRVTHGHHLLKEARPNTGRLEPALHDPVG